jgi:hypothetical protein
MIQPFPRQPTDVWVQTAAMMVRGELTNEGVITPSEAVEWLAALEAAALDALHALDNIQRVLTDATSGPAAVQHEASPDDGRHRFRTLGSPDDGSSSG